MTCFIAHPTVCRAYAKCNGWQETMAHFFIKSRRSTPIPPVQRFPSTSTSTKDQSVDSGRESCDGANIDSSNVHVPLVSTTTTMQPPQIFETSSSPDDPNQGPRIRQLDLSPIPNENAHRSLTQTLSTPSDSLMSSSLLTPMTTSTMDIDGTTPEFLRRNESDEFHPDTIGTVATPLQSSTNSREDLLSLMKTDASNDDVVSVTSSNDASSVFQAATTPSIKHLCDDEDETQPHRRLGPELRQILGRLIALLDEQRFPIDFLLWMMCRSVK